MKKTFAIKFGRNPKFTPSLPDDQLSRIEALAMEYARRHWSLNCKLQKGVEGADAAHWIATHSADRLLEWSGVGGDMSWLGGEGDAAYDYLRTCVNFLVTVAINSREALPYRAPTRREMSYRCSPGHPNFY